MTVAILALMSAAGFALAYYHAREHARVQSVLSDQIRARVAAETQRDIATARVGKELAVIDRLHGEIRRLEDDLQLCEDPGVVRARFDRMFGEARANRGSDSP